MYPGTWAQKTPDKPAYIMTSTGETVTYRQLDERSNRLAHYWRDQGLRPGDHVAILMENNARYVEVMWAALRSGLIFTPVNWHLLPHEVAYVMDNCGARRVVTSTRFADTTRAARADCPAVESVLLVGAEAAVPGFEPYEATLMPYPTTPVADEVLGSDMHYSAGTTGRPKGGVQPVPAGHPATTQPTLQPFFDPFGLTQDTVYLSPGGPLYHAAPGRWAQFATAAGATCVIHDRFDPLEALQAIGRYGVTHSQWVPTMFIRMLRLPAEQRARYDGSTHRQAIHAAAPCPAWAKREMIDWWGPILVEYYGGSEGGSGTLIDSAEWLSHPGSVGKADIGVLHIVDEATGEELPPGEIGAIRFECDQRPVHYRLDEAKTRSAYDERGWSTIGDVGYLDEDGYLYLTDRKDYTIIAGGVNIYPQEAEDALLRHPAVLDAAVFGIPHDEYGEQVKAVVELADKSLTGPAAEQLLIEHCRSELATYKCPRSIDFADELPRSSAGKLYKRRLRDRYWPAATTGSRQR
jgi:acyl-CoA synthetase (AMP-forming)/AMP-acid ligase II